jgi:hypothetical protein
MVLKNGVKESGLALWRGVVKSGLDNNVEESGMVLRNIFMESGPVLRKTVR